MKTEKEEVRLQELQNATRVSLALFAVAALLPIPLLAISANPATPTHDRSDRAGIRVGVPLYTDSKTEWSKAVDAGDAVTMIFLNPANGPGNSFNSTYAHLVKKAQKEGVKVLGYIDTAYANGTTSAQQAKNWVDEYYSWYKVNGIFFDEVTDKCATTPVAYYSGLYNYVKARGEKNLVVLNPGTFVEECYAKISDVLVTYEDSYANYLNYHQPGWVNKYPSSHFLHIVLNATSIHQMQNAILLAAARNVGFVFVTDLGANGTNPYSTLPSYFHREIEYLEHIGRSE